MDHPVYKPLGNFVELKAFDFTDAISIHDAICELPHEKEKEILKYLEKGREYIFKMGLYFDIIGKNHKDITGYGSFITDEIWEWRDDLPYYIRKYHVRLSDEFMTYLEEKNWGNS